MVTFALYECHVNYKHTHKKTQTAKCHLGDAGLRALRHRNFKAESYPSKGGRASQGQGLKRTGDGAASQKEHTHIKEAPRRGRSQPGRTAHPAALLWSDLA